MREPHQHGPNCRHGPQGHAGGHGMQQGAHGMQQGGHGQQGHGGHGHGHGAGQAPQMSPEQYFKTLK